MGHRSTEADGRVALREHVRDCATTARRKYGGVEDRQILERILEDRTVVRYPVEIRFRVEPLLPGEFGWTEPKGSEPSQGYVLWIHPSFRDREEILPLLVAYHLVRVNYGEIATHREAELFGATLLGLDIEEYYRILCELVDGLPPSNHVPVEEAS